MVGESVGNDLALAQVAETAAAERRPAEAQAFVDKLAKRPPPNAIERAAIEKARRRTKSSHATHCYEHRGSRHPQVLAQGNEGRQLVMHLDAERACRAQRHRRDWGGRVFPRACRCSVERVLRSHSKPLPHLIGNRRPPADRRGELRS